MNSEKQAFPKIHLLGGTWQELKPYAMPIRTQVFVYEQKVPIEIEMDDMDECALHVVAFLQYEDQVFYKRTENAIATGRLLPDGHIGRMAVMPLHRNKKVGKKVLNALMIAAERMGHKKVMLSAQTHAQNFYLQSGFQSVSDIYMAAGIAHIDMEKYF